MKMVDVETARRKLVEALGGCAEKYWSNLKLWYKQKISKDDFDSQAFELLGPGKINYHNEFIISILAKCEMIAYNTPNSVYSSRSSSKSHSKSSQLCKPRVRRSNLSPVQNVKPFVCNDWSDGIPMIIPKTLLRNVLCACVSRRKSFELREGSHFSYQYGRVELKSDILNEKLTMKSHDFSGKQQHQTFDQAEAVAHTKLACGSIQPVVRSPISLFDLRDTILNSPQIIPSISLRLTSLERISSFLWHPSKDELHQHKMYILDTRKVHEKIKQQRALRTDFSRM